MSNTPVAGDTKCIDNDATRTLFAAATAEMQSYAFAIGNTQVKMDLDKMTKYEIAVATAYGTVQASHTENMEAATKEMKKRLAEVFASAGKK